MRKNKELYGNLSSTFYFYISEIALSQPEVFSRSHLSNIVNITISNTMVNFSRGTLQFDGACIPNPGEGGAFRNLVQFPK